MDENDVPKAPQALFHPFLQIPPVSVLKCPFAAPDNVAPMVQYLLPPFDYDSFFVDKTKRSKMGQKSSANENNF